MKIDVFHIAKLANLPISEEENEKFQKQLSAILDYFKKLKEVDTSKVEETSQTTGLENISRIDQTTPSLPQEEALSNAKSKHNGLFKVKAIFKEQ